MGMKVRGHTDARTAMQFQDPGLESIREPSTGAIYGTNHVTVNCECTKIGGKCLKEWSRRADLNR
jgi:hypothetical protein